MEKLGFISKKYEFELKILAKYYYTQSMSLEQIKCRIREFCAKHLPEFNEVKYMNMVNRAAKYAEKNGLFTVSPIHITENELKSIGEIKDLKLEKIAFILLVISKINRQSYICFWEDKKRQIEKFNKNKPIPELFEGYYASGKINSFFKMAKIYMNKQERNATIKTLIDRGLIDMTKSCKYKINFVDESSETKIIIDKFNNFVLEYMRYIGDNIGSCEVCGELFEIRGNRHKFCKICWKEKQLEKYRKYNAKRNILPPLENTL